MPPSGNFASLHFPSLFERERFSEGEVFPLTTPVGETSSPPLSFASLASCWGDKLPSKDYRKPFTPALNILVYIPLECNTYLLSRTIGYGIQATLHRKVPTTSFITYPFLTSLYHTSHKQLPISPAIIHHAITIAQYLPTIYYIKCAIS